MSAGVRRPLRSRVWRKLLRRKGAMFGAVLALLFLAVAILAPYLAPYDPLRTDWSAVRSPPSPQHWLGTDELGRDVLSRVIWGARASLLAGVVSVAIAMALGVPLGLLSGYYRGWIDEVIMRFTDALLAFPFLILAIALAAMLGPSLTNAMIAIGVSTAPAFIRLARGQVLSVMVEEFVQAARALGASDARIMLKHVLPNAFSPLLIQGTLAVAAAIIAESSLSFLGLGQQPPAPSWGSMLNVAKNFLAEAPWMAVWPGIAIFITVLAFNLLGDGLRDALDPRDW